MDTQTKPGKSSAKKADAPNLDALSWMQESGGRKKIQPQDVRGNAGSA